VKTFRTTQVASPGAELAIVDQRLGDPGPGAVRIAVEACGVCHSDSVFVGNQWPDLRLRTDRSMIVKHANANPVVPGNGRLV